jgi:hypothetical protein
VTGFDVSPQELRQFAGKINTHHSTASQIAGLVAKADVSDKSWGVVGLFVKSTYTRMLDEFNDLMKDMQEGLKSASDKFTGTAQGYQQKEDELRQLFDGIQIEFTDK